MFFKITGSHTRSSGSRMRTAADQEGRGWALATELHRTNLVNDHIGSDVLEVVPE